MWPLLIYTANNNGPVIGSGHARPTTQLTSYGTMRGERFVVTYGSYYYIFSTQRSDDPDVRKIVDQWKLLRRELR